MMQRYLSLENSESGIKLRNPRQSQINSEEKGFSNSKTKSSSDHNDMIDNLFDMQGIQQMINSKGEIDSNLFFMLTLILLLINQFGSLAYLFLQNNSYNQQFNDHYEFPSKQNYTFFCIGLISLGGILLSFVFGNIQSLMNNIKKKEFIVQEQIHLLLTTISLIKQPKIIQNQDMSQLVESQQNNNNITNELVSNFQLFLEQFNKKPEEQKLEIKIDYIEFQVHYVTNFGEEIYLIGSSNNFGLWDAQNKALKLKWTQNHIWKISFNREQIDNQIEFKHVMKNNNQNYLRWEEGQNHQFSMQDTIKKLENKQDCQIQEINNNQIEVYINNTKLIYDNLNNVLQVIISWQS